jgi:hypothetical protein
MGKFPCISSCDVKGQIKFYKVDTLKTHWLVEKIKFVNFN